MEKELNLVEILKDCPKGTKLYSTIHGEVEFEEVIINDHYPVKYKFIDKYGMSAINRTTIDGRHFLPSNGECTLFPSKDQRDWSKFNIEPKFDISTLQPFDKVLGRDRNDQKWQCDFYDHHEKGVNFQFKTINNCYRQCIPYNNETKRLVGTTKIPLEKYINWEE